MLVSDLLKKRRSIRAFQKTTVPDDVIRNIFSEAQMSASNCNTQPWHVSIVSGDACAQLAKDLVAHIRGGGKPSPAFQPGDYGLKDVYRERQIDCAMALYSELGIERSDKAAREKQMMKNFEFFGAPHVAIFSMPKEMREVNAVDVGIYLQAVMLLMVEQGIDCCAQGALAHFPKPFETICNIPAENGIMFGLSFGYADEQDPVNNAKMTRAKFEDFAEMIN